MKTTTVPTTPAAIRAALIHGLTQLDARNSTRADYNRNALPIYFRAVEDVMADLAAGADLRAALSACFSGRVLAACLRAVNLPKATDDEWSGRTRGGPWHYVPASAKAAPVESLPSVAPEVHSVAVQCLASGRYLEVRYGETGTCGVRVEAGQTDAAALLKQADEDSVKAQRLLRMAGIYRRAAGKLIREKTEGKG